MSRSQPTAGPVPAWPPLNSWIAVAIAGFLGTEARYLLGVLFPEPAHGFPATTLIINVLGSLILGLLTARWSRHPGRPWLRAALGPGLLGSFTTFSAVVIVVDSLSRDGFWPVALWYLLISLCLGIAAAAAGLHWGRDRHLQKERA